MGEAGRGALQERGERARPAWILPVIVASQFAGTSLWFAGNAVLGDLQAAWGLAPSALATPLPQRERVKKCPPGMFDYTITLPSSVIASSTETPASPRIISLCARPDGIIGKQFSF